MPDWSLEWDRDTGVYNLDRSRVTYRVPLEFITRVNGSYNDGGTTYKFILFLSSSVGRVADC